MILAVRIIRQDFINYLIKNLKVNLLSRYTRIFFFAKKQNQLTGIKVCDISYISKPVLLALHSPLKVSLLPIQCW